MSLKRVLIAGEGGQGIQVLAQILTKCAFADGYHVTYLPNFGVEQRGGVSLAFLQISKEEISFPKFAKADFLTVLAPRAVERIEEYLQKETVLIFDNTDRISEKVKDIRLEKVAIPASNIAKEKLIPRVFNIVMLGALAAELDLKEKNVEKEMEKFFLDKLEKEPQLKHFNRKAFEVGFQIADELKRGAKWRQKILNK